MDRIATVFERARVQERAAFMPYYPLGYPSLERSLDIVEDIAASGADLLELGIPFSDPLADGPTIQRATHVALQRGTTVARCLEAARELRRRGIAIPFLFMGYYNPILAFGLEAFCRACREAGVDGFIVPDLPPEEGGELEAACVRHGLALIYLLAPTSTLERVRLVSARSRDFVYLVSVTGITGAREQLPSGLRLFVERVRRMTDKPLAVGFGISTPEQARQVAALADGVIVGSALVRLVGDGNGMAGLASFVQDLCRAVAKSG